MLSGLCRVVAVNAICCVLAGCTTVGETKKGAVGFNRVFSDARNEVLLLNVLRARYNEPLQFSTISTVTGSMRPDFKLTGGLDNLILGAANAFKPAGEVDLLHPSVTIGPLESKEFRQGMMKPIDAKFVDDLIAQGWSKDVVLHLVLGGIMCDDVTYQNYNGVDRDAKEVITFAQKVDWHLPRPALMRGKSFLLNTSAAAKLIREGAGDGLKIVPVDAESGDPAGKLRLQIVREAPQMVNLGQANPCHTPTNTIEAGKLIFRSPMAMIRYLGVLTRNSEGGNDYFRVLPARNSIPQDAVVGTRFQNALFYVPRTEPAGRYKPSETLALLAEIIGFQTTDASLGASKPVVTVPAQ